MTEDDANHFLLALRLLGRNPVLEVVAATLVIVERQKLAESATGQSQWHSVDTNPLKRCNPPADGIPVRDAVERNDYSDTTWQTGYDL